MEDLKFITAANIISLRTKAGMTQAQLAELLNYSDKSVSKWERAEAVPDAYVLNFRRERGLPAFFPQRLGADFSKAETPLPQ